MTLLELFESFESTGVGAAVRESIWLFPALEAVHLLGLASLGGAVLVLDLRLLDLGLRSRSIAEVAKSAEPWFFASLGLMLATGVPLFLSEAVKCYYNTSYWVKMAALGAAVTFALTIRRRVVRSPTAESSRNLPNRLTGGTSLLLWFTVAAAGRWIGFS